MSQDYTRGPWRIEQSESHIDIHATYKRMMICEIPTHDSAGPIADPDEDMANAKLIAAAPAMASAIEIFLSEWPEGRDGMDYRGLLSYGVKRMREALRISGVKVP